MGQTIPLSFYDFVDGPNWQPWSNRLTGWDGTGRIVYTIEGINPALTPEDLDVTLNSGVGAVPIRFVENDPLNNFPLLASSETGYIMPWREGGVMDSRKLNVTFGKNGQGNTSTKITLPLPWLREMGVSEEHRQVKLSFDGKSIVIEKAE